MSDIFVKTHRFDCSCGNIVAVRFSQLSVGDRYCHVEVWHKDVNKLHAATEFKTGYVGYYLRALLDETGCESRNWFTPMVLKE